MGLIEARRATVRPGSLRAHPRERTRPTARSAVLCHRCACMCAATCTSVGFCERNWIRRTKHTGLQIHMCTCANTVSIARAHSWMCVCGCGPDLTRTQSLSLLTHRTPTHVHTQHSVYPGKDDVAMCKKGKSDAPARGRSRAGGADHWDGGGDEGRGGRSVHALNDSLNGSAQKYGVTGWNDHSPRRAGWGLTPLDTLIQVCMYMNACVCSCTLACMHVCIHASMHTCMHVCMSACLHVCTCVCVYMHACMHACAHAIYACKYVCKLAFINIRAHKTGVFGHPVHTCIHTLEGVCQHVNTYDCENACKMILFANDNNAGPFPSTPYSPCKQRGSYATLRPTP